MRVIEILAASLCLIATTSFGAPSDAAQGAATGWVALVDSGAYAQSWAQAGRQFQTHITADGWAKAAAPAREPLGAVVTRSIESNEAATSLPGAPDGDYRVFKFHTQFANKHDAVETVVVEQEAGDWKVDGYFIR